MKMSSKKQLLRTCDQNPQIQFRILEAATGGVLEKKVFLKIWQTSQENSCVGFNPATFLKRDSNTRVLLWNLRKFQNIYFEEHLRTTASGILRLESYNFTKNELCLSYFSRNLPAGFSCCLKSPVEKKFATVTEEQQEKERNKQDHVLLNQNWQPVDISAYLDLCTQQ